MVTFKKMNNSSAKVIWDKTDDDPYKQNPHKTLDNIYAIRPEGFMFHPSFRANRNRQFSKYDGKVRLYKLLTNTLPLGLVNESVNSLRKFGWSVTVDDDITNSFNDDTDYSSLITSLCSAIERSCGLTPRDYQIRILEIAMKLKRAAFRAATGAGKSLSIFMIVRFLMKVIDTNIKILILVPNINLVNQLFRNFRDDYAWSNVENYVGMYSSDFTPNEKKVSIEKQVLISTWQSMGSLLEFNSSDEYFKRFSCIIVDELHSAKNDHAIINKVITSCINAEYRFGLTGTIPRHTLDQKVIIGNFGEIKTIISSRELIERGELSKATIVEVKIKYDKKTIDLCRKKKIPLDSEYELVRQSRSHEYAIHSLIRDGLITSNQNTLILMKYVENNELGDVVEMIQNRHKEFLVRIAHGKVSVKKREEILSEIESKVGIIIVSTYATFGTGFNMKNLHNVIFASNSKSYIRILQSIGRSLRVHKSKSMAKIYDLHHMLEDEYVSNRTNRKIEYRSNLARHFYERLGFYCEEEYPLEFYNVDKKFAFPIGTIPDLTRKVDAKHLAM